MSRIKREFHFGLIGYPLTHSYSPVLHQAALKANQLEGSYKLFPISPGSEAKQKLKYLAELIRLQQLHGLNVTIPHKQNILEVIDGQSALSEMIGAVNTIYYDHGFVWGENTDAPAFDAELVRSEIADEKQALILGAGGACRAVCYTLLSRGWNVQIAARHIEQVLAIQKQLQEKFGQDSIKPVELSNEGLISNISSIALIVNTTPVGMVPHTDVSPWPEWLEFPKSAMLIDLIYNPARTKLMEQASAVGLQCMNGSGMLIEQAALAFELWTGLQAPRAAMQAALESEINHLNHEN